MNNEAGPLCGPIYLGSLHSSFHLFFTVSSLGLHWALDSTPIVRQRGEGYTMSR